MLREAEPPRTERLNEVLVAAFEDEGNQYTREAPPPAPNSTRRMRMDTGRRYWSRFEHRTGNSDNNNDNNASLYINSNDSSHRLEEEPEEGEDGFFGLVPSTAEIQRDGDFVQPSSYLRRYAMVQRRNEETSLPMAINSLSTDSLVMDILSASSESTIFRHSEECGEPKQGSFMLSAPINRRLDEFMSKRREMALLYDDHKKRKSCCTKKRTFREVIGEKETEPYSSFMFEEIRLQQSSFLKAGICHKCVTDDINMSFLHVDLPSLQARGFFEFKSTQTLRKWRKSYTASSRRGKAARDGSSVLNFTASIVDFERFDLRYKPHSYDALIGTFTDGIRGSYGTSNKSVYSVMYSNFVNKQFYKWRLLKPFKGISVEQHKFISTCVRCLSMLQKTHVIMLISLEDDEHTEFLMSLDKKSGAVELVSAELSGDADVNSLRRSAIGIVHSLDKVFRFMPSSERYVSPSICIS